MNNSNHPTTTTTTTTTTSTTQQPAPNPDERVFNINLVKGTKKWNLAKFSTKIDIHGFSKPVKMYKYNPMTQIAQDDQKAAAEAAALNGVPYKPFKRKYEPKPVNAKTIPWKLEDSQGNNTFQGTVEGNQSSSNYFLFMFQSDGTIKAVPCTDWYNFRPKKDLQTLTTEEAEDFMKKKYQEWDFLTSRVKKNQDGNEKSSGGGSGGGGGGGSGGGSKKSKADDDDDEDSELRRNIYEDPNKFKSYGVVKTESKPAKKPARKREENYNEEDGDAPDFEGKFDDDDDDTYMDDEAVDESHPHLQDEDENEEELNQTGLEMQKMLKNIQKKEEQSEEEEEDKEEEEDDDDEDDDDDDEDDEDLDADFSITTKNDTIVVKEENGGPPSPTNGKKKKSSTTTTTTTSSKSSSSPPKDKKTSTTSTSSSSSTNITGKKTKSSDSNDTRDTKKIKKEPSSPPPPTNTSSSATSSPPSSAIGGGGSEGPLTEDDIRKVIQKEKRIKSIDLINTFRNHLKDPNNKKEFLSIVGRIARVVIEDGIKYIIAK
ncbi:hypothetical protein CYY_004094 [Polysphondylium violaceum]|uniref:Transcription initiation factor IIF subunit alpha n=1 Tax=Polysphondylium violaceum TaxID=133409 RepID=A0A8J4PVR2_9MYCE|nr:hypothetical protein CYY_004094 [Polysphondylium violaceum]